RASPRPGGGASRGEKRIRPLAQVNPGACPRAGQGQESPSAERGQSSPVLGVERSSGGAGTGRSPSGGTWRKLVWRPDQLVRSAPGPPAGMGSGADGPTSRGCSKERGASAGSSTSGSCAREGEASASTSGACR